MALCTILLLAHDPRIPALGPLRTPALDDADVNLHPIIIFLRTMLIDYSLKLKNKSGLSVAWHSQTRFSSLQKL